MVMAIILLTQKIPFPSIFSKTFLVPHSLQIKLLSVMCKLPFVSKR